MLSTTNELSRFAQITIQIAPLLKHLKKHPIVYICIPIALSLLAQLFHWELSRSGTIPNRTTTLLLIKKFSESGSEETPYYLNPKLPTPKLNDDSNLFGRSQVEYFIGTTVS